MKLTLEKQWPQVCDAAYSNQDKSSLLLNKNIIRIEASDDPLRSSENFNTGEVLQIKDLPHSLLAFDQINFDLIKVKIHDLCR